MTRDRSHLAPTNALFLRKEIRPKIKLSTTLAGRVSHRQGNLIENGMILLRTLGSRLATRGSSRVPFKRLVLRPLGTDNSAHQQVVKQPWTTIGTANLGRVTLLYVIPYLWTAESIGLLCPQHTPGLLPSNTVSVCWLTRANSGRQNFPAKLRCGPCWTNEWKAEKGWVHL